MMRELLKPLAALLIVLFAAPPVGASSQQEMRSGADVLRTYVERIPAGSRVRVTLQDGSRLRGVMMMVEDDHVIVRERKRRPEPPLRLPLTQVVDVELDQNGGGLARGIAIGAAVGAGAALGVIALLAAIFAD